MKNQNQPKNPSTHSTSSGQAKLRVVTPSSKKIILILAIALIAVGIILIVILSNNRDEKNEMPYSPGNIEVEVIEGSGGNQISQPQTTGDVDMANELGAATTGDINGGSSGIQQAPAGSTEELLEGKEVEVK